MHAFDPPRAIPQWCAHAASLLFSTLLLLSTFLLLSTSVAAAQLPVARISVELPQMESFLLQATVPVPPATFLPGATTMPLAVVSNGAPATTQVEVVSRYPRASDGAAVVELIARVSRPAGLAPGAEAIFDVVQHNHAPSAHEPGSEALALLATPGAIKLASRDIYGNRYEADLYAKPRAGASGVDVLRNGTYVREVRTHEVLLHGPSTLGQPLPHMMGVHATFRTYTNENFVALDLHVHNGMDGRDFTTPIDDVLYDIYFDRLDLEVPNGWQVLAAYDTTYQGAPIVGAGATVWPLVDSLRQGQLHNLPQQAQFSRRYVLARSNNAVARGREVLARRTFGFAMPGYAAPLHELWSWWNPDTAGYLPQRNALPLLSHLNLANLRASLTARRNELVGLIADGVVSSQAGYPFNNKTLGWANPWGYGYGGMTGGTEIEQWPGAQIAWARTQAGLQLMEIQGQSYEDRQPTALYTASGRPTRLESMVQPQPGTHGPWVPTTFFLRPPADNNYFAFPIANRTQAHYAYETFRVPYYEKELKDYQQIDLQHLTRYMNAWLVLAWLTNDAEAKLTLELHAELNRLTFHEYYCSYDGYVNGIGLLARQLTAQAHPGKGGEWGRGEAWGLQANLAWYALGTDEARARYRPWFALISDASRRTVSLCTGNPTSLRIQKNFKAAFQSRQSFEASYFLHAIQGLRRSVFENVDPAVHADLTFILTEGARSSINAPYWNPQARAQNRLVATRLYPYEAPDFCTNVPIDGFTPHYDPWTAMTTWAYAFQETRDPIYLQRAAEVVGGSNALASFESGGLTDIADKAPMLALIQYLNR